MDLHKFKKLPILGIIRGIKKPYVKPLVETVISSGLKTIEVTMNTPYASDIIKRAVNSARGELMVGAGTVLNLSDLKKAIDSGATFIVSPTFIPDVVKYCVKNAIPVFPGALTPQEIYTAWNEGATMVKVFPADVFGPDYFKTVKGPFSNIKLLACGGVNPSNIRAFFDKGASAVTFGSSIFNNKLIEEKKFSLIKKKLKTLINSIG